MAAFQETATAPTAAAAVQDLSSRSVSHNIVASFQENELLEMLRPSLSPAAKQTLVKEGPQVFAAR